MESPFNKVFPEIKESNKGKFTKWAKARGMSACQAWVIKRNIQKM